MTHPCESAARIAMAALRAGDRPLRAERGKHLVPQVYFSWDAEQARVDLDLLPEPGALVRLRAEVTGTPRWLTLSVALGSGAFQGGEGLGLALTARLDQPFTLQPILRSRLGDATHDTRFADPIELDADQRVGVSLAGLLPADPIVGEGQYHTLIVPLPLARFDMVLGDLRFFVLGASRAEGLALPRLGSFAN